MNFYEKFVRLCNERKISPSAASLDIGLKKSAVTRWKKGGMPTDATVAKLCDYFKVAPNYFENEETPTPEGERYSPTMQKIVDALKGKSEDQLDKLLKIIETANEIL